MVDKTASAEDDAGALDGTEVVRVVKSGSKRTTSQAIANLAPGLTSETLPAAIAVLGVPQSVTVTLTAADLAVLNDAPFSVISLPAGKAIFVLAATAIYVHGGAGMFACSGEIRHYYRNGDGQYATETALFATDPGVNKAYFRQGKVLSAGMGEFVDVAIWIDGDNPVLLGNIVSSSINVAGTGFSEGDPFTLDGGAGSLADGVVDAVDESGGIVGYHLNPNVAAFYPISDISLSATSGEGSGATINITELDYSRNPTSLQVTTFYAVTAAP